MDDSNDTIPADTAHDALEGQATFYRLCLRATSIGWFGAGSMFAYLVAEFGQLPLNVVFGVATLAILVAIGARLMLASKWKQIIDEIDGGAEP